jgi:hypothetical protein
LRRQSHSSVAKCENQQKKLRGQQKHLKRVPATAVAYLGISSMYKYEKTIRKRRTGGRDTGISKEMAY